MSGEHSLQSSQMTANSPSSIQKRTQVSSDSIFSEMPRPNIQLPAPGLPSTSAVNEVSPFSERNAFPGSSREPQAIDGVSNSVDFPLPIKEENKEKVPFPGSRGGHEFLKEDNTSYQKRSQKSQEETTSSSTTRSRNRQPYRVPPSHLSSPMSPQVLLAEVRRTHRSTDVDYQPLSSEVNITRYNPVSPQGYHRRYAHRINVAQNTYPRTNEFQSHPHSSYFRNISPFVWNEPPLFVQQASKLRRHLKVYETFHNIHGISESHNDKHSVNQQFTQNTYRPLFDIHRQPEQNYFIGYQSTNNGCHKMQNPYAQAILRQIQTDNHAQQFYQQQIGRQELRYYNTLDQQILSYNREQEQCPETSLSYITNPAERKLNDFSAQSTSYLANINECKFSNLAEINEKDMQITKKQLDTYQHEISAQTPSRENTEYEQKAFEFQNNTCYIQTYNQGNNVEPEGSPIQTMCELRSNDIVQSKLVAEQGNMIDETQRELNKDALTNETDGVAVHTASRKPIESVDSCIGGPGNTTNSDETKEGNGSTEITVISGASSEAEAFVTIETSSRKPQTETSQSVFLSKPNVVGDSGELKETAFAEFSIKPDIVPSIVPLIEEKNVFLLSTDDIEQAKVLDGYESRDFPYLISEKPEISPSNVSVSVQHRKELPCETTQKENPLNNLGNTNNWKELKTVPEASPADEPTPSILASSEKDRKLYYYRNEFVSHTNVVDDPMSMSRNRARKVKETVFPEVSTGSDIFPSIEIHQEEKNVVLLSIDGIKQAEVVDNSGFQASPGVLLEQAEVPPAVNSSNLTHQQHQCVVPLYTECVPQSNVLGNYASQVAYYELLKHALSEVSTLADVSTSISLPPEQYQEHVQTFPDEQYRSSSGESEQYLPEMLDVAGTSASISPHCFNNQALFLLPTDSVAMANEPPAGECSENLRESLQDLLTLQDMPLLERIIPSVFSFDEYEIEMISRDLIGLGLPEPLIVDVNSLTESSPMVPLPQVPLFTNPVSQIKGLPSKEEAMDTESDVKHPPFKIPKKSKKNIKLSTNGTRKSNRRKRIPDRLFYIQKGLQF